MSESNVTKVQDTDENLVTAESILYDAAEFKGMKEPQCMYICITPQPGLVNLMLKDQPENTVVIANIGGFMGDSNMNGQLSESGLISSGFLDMSNVAPITYGKFFMYIGNTYGHDLANAVKEMMESRKEENK